MDLFKLHQIVEKILPVITKPPYDNVRFRIQNYKGLYEMSFVFELPEELYDIIKKKDENSNIEEVNARFEAYRLLKTINNYLNTRIVINDIRFEEKR